jgi:hypothetical protein
MGSSFYEVREKEESQEK